jgi:hypothetical protein
MDQSKPIIKATKDPKSYDISEAETKEKHGVWDPMPESKFSPSQGLWIWPQEVFNTVPYAGRYDSSHPPSGVAPEAALSSRPGYRYRNIEFSSRDSF